MSIETSGANGVRILSTNLLRNVAGATLMGWNIQDVVEAVNHCLMGVSINGATTNRAVIATTTTTSMRSRVRALDADAESVTTQAASLAAGVRQHFAIVFDATNDDVYHYKNGVLQGSAADVATTPGNTSDTSSDRTELGRQPGGSQGWDGTFEDLRVYHEILSAARIRSIYEADGRDGDIQGLHARWPLDEAAPGTTASGAGNAKDHSANKYDGEALSSPVYRASFACAGFSRRRVH